jgi:chemotaxis protein MotB
MIQTMNKTPQILHLLACLLISCIGLVLSSCVSQLRYNRLSTEVSSLRNDRDEALKKSESTKLENIRLEKENKALQDENAKLKLDSAQSGAMYRKNKALLNDVFDKYERLDKSYNSLLSNSSNERTFTEKEIQRKEADLAKKEKELNDMKAQLALQQAEYDKKKEEANRLSQDVGSKDSKIKEMESQLAAKDKMLADFKAKMTAALLTLNNSNLQVQEKDGKVYVVLPNQTLFATGSYALQQAGKEAISKVAQVLIQNPDLEVSVEGHTDNSPFKPKTPPSKTSKTAKKGGKKPATPAVVAGVKDNWDLSSLRSATVARELYLQGVSGNRISATGKGEFYPLDNSMSEEAKMRNRRIEIVISPKLSSLYQLIQR